MSREPIRVHSTFSGGCPGAVEQNLLQFPGDVAKKTACRRKPNSVTIDGLSGIRSRRAHRNSAVAARQKHSPGTVQPSHLIGALHWNCGCHRLPNPQNGGQCDCPPSGYLRGFFVVALMAGRKGPVPAVLNALTVRKYWLFPVRPLTVAVVWLLGTLTLPMVSGLVSSSQYTTWEAGGHVRHSPEHTSVGYGVSYMQKNYSVIHLFLFLSPHFAYSQCVPLIASVLSFFLIYIHMLFIYCPYQFKNLFINYYFLFQNKTLLTL